MSTLKVNKLRDTAGSTDAITLDPNGGAVLAGVTTMTTARVTSGIVTNTFIVGAGVTISESGIEASGIGITCANINGGAIGGRRNLVINGDMRIAQRATTNNTAGASSNYNTLDRYMVQIQSGTLTESQQNLSSSDTPYTLGFRKYMRILNQSGIGAGVAQYAEIDQRIEAQDVAQSGWNYTSSSSYITLSFWVRASVAQAYVAVLYTNDGTQRHYPFEIKDSGGSTLSADTWTKITKTIPGNSGITISNDSGNGATLSFIAAYGTNYTDGSGTFDAWNTTGGGTTRWPDMTTTWATTTNATFDITGVQLEVGSQATSFEHRHMAEELLLCQRYYFKLGKQDYLGTHMSANEVYGIGMSDNDDTNVYSMINFPVRMRTPPTALDQSGSAADYRLRRDTTKDCSSVPTFVEAAEHYCRVNFVKSGHGWGTGQMLWCMSAGSSGYLGFSAEL